MNETQKALLAKGVVVLPNRIEHEVYEYVLEAVTTRPEQIVMYCKGDGGDVSSALAIVDLIQQHGNVVGMLPGEANSSHATIFAGCQERYVYPNGFMGVHQIAWDSHNGRLDAHNLRLLAVDFDSTDAQVAGILAAASNKSMDWWYKVLRDTGSGGVTRYPARQMIQFGLARDVGEWKPKPEEPHPQPLPLQGEGSEKANIYLGGLGAIHFANGTKQDVAALIGEKPMVTAEQIEQLKGLGYEVVDCEGLDGYSRGPYIRITQGNDIDGFLTYEWTISDAWKRALDHAVANGLITDNKASVG